MEHGKITEPIAREWYEHKYNLKVKSMGFAIPKWQNLLGCSPDGLVDEDGLLEIKCPQKMYPKLEEYLYCLQNGCQPYPYYHEHIIPSHYDQIQGEMGILNKKWCDYVIFDTYNNKCNVERIPFAEEYWLELKSKLLEFIDKYLKETEYI